MSLVVSSPFDACVADKQMAKAAEIICAVATFFPVTTTYLPVK